MQYGPGGLEDDLPCASDVSYLLDPVVLLLLGWVLGPGHGEHGAARLILGHQVALEVVSSMMAKT